MDKEIYRVYGVVNVFDHVPGFMNAIYVKDNSFYFAECSCANRCVSRYINKFSKIDDSVAFRDMISRARRYASLDGVNLDGFDGESCLESDYMYFYELPNGRVIVGGLDDMKEFLTEYVKTAGHTIDSVAMENIKAFLDTEAAPIMKPASKTK